MGKIYTAKPLGLVSSMLKPAASEPASPLFGRRKSAFLTMMLPERISRNLEAWM
jgi:hypothetical protein